MVKDDEYNLLQRRRSEFNVVQNTTLCFGVMVLSVLIGVGIGVGIGFVVFGGAKTDSCIVSVPTTNDEFTLLEWGALVGEGNALASSLDRGTEQMQARNIEDNIKKLSQLPRMAGTDQNNQVAEEIYQQWMALEFDRVEQIKYQVLLQYPNATNPNQFQVVNGNGDVVFDAPTAKLEPSLTDDERQPGIVRPFNSYSGIGNVKGPLVFINYGKLEDYDTLTSMNISVSGCVCIARYGISFRGSQAKLAEQNGCLGLVLYTDPSTFGPKEGYPAYPEGMSLPLSGVQRGSVQTANGDPLTPLRPSIPGVYRRSYEEAVADHTLPSILVTPISSGDASHFLSRLNQTSRAPDHWQGGLNITYHIGPGFNEENKDNEVYLEVNNYFENRTIVNVVATIFGSQEPDHPVLLGTHRDTWVFGAVDATGATGTLLEIAQSLGSLRVAGWRPGRTIMLCSWDASEYCMLGSTEFAEDHAKALLLNAVAYMNVDFCVAGRDYVLGRASPLLIPVMYEAAKKVKSPNNPNMSIYDEMLSVVPGADGKPIISTLAAGSDYTPFIQTLGIPSGDFAYSPNPKTSPFGFYPMYHTIHDSFAWMKKYVDFDFTYHLAIGKLWLRAALHLATTPIIPFGVVEYGYHLHKMAMSLNESNYDILMKENISLDFLYESIESFKISAQSLQNAADYVNSQHLNETARLKMWRILNSNLLGVERSLIVSEGLPGRPSLKHSVFAPSKLNNYKTSAFPGISDAIFEREWSEVKKQISTASLNIRAAAEVMSDSLDPAIYHTMTCQNHWRQPFSNQCHECTVHTGL